MGNFYTVAQAKLPNDFFLIRPIISHWKTFWVSGAANSRSPLGPLFFHGLLLVITGLAFSRFFNFGLLTWCQAGRKACRKLSDRITCLQVSASKLWLPFEFSADWGRSYWGFEWTNALGYAYKFSSRHQSVKLLVLLSWLYNLRLHCQRVPRRNMSQSPSFTQYK